MGEWEEKNNIPPSETPLSPSLRFARLLKMAFERTGQRVVVLIDEYDQPLLQNIEEGKEKLHDELRLHLQSFYSMMKAQDRYIRFAMLTGITRFSKLSVFSGLNNLKDITLDVKSNAICGVSETELNDNFQQSIADLADATGLSVVETGNALKKEYDGYHFAKSGEGIYNPFSLLSTFDNEVFSHYWMESGTPSFMIHLLKKRDWNLSEIDGSKCKGEDLKGADRYLSDPIPLLFQSGYLTIKDYDQRFDEYTLDYPNEEVREGFISDLLKNFASNKKVDSIIYKFVKDVEDGEVDSFMNSLQSLLADVPYSHIPDKELHYENLMYLIMN